MVFQTVRFMRRIHEDRVCLTSQLDVGDILPLSSQEPAVFLAAHRLSNPEAHIAPSFRRGLAAYDQTAPISSREKFDIFHLPVLASVRCPRNCGRYRG